MARVTELDCLYSSGKARALYEMTGQRKREMIGITTRQEEKPSRNGNRNALRG
jgi:hypothetical protein